MNSVVLNKTNPKQELKFNPEAPFVKITNLEILTLKPENEDAFAHIIFANSIQIKSYLNGTKTVVESINLQDFNQLKKDLSNGKININRIVLDSLNVNKLEFTIDNLTQFEFMLKVNYETFNQNINIANPSKNFKAHIDLNDNVKILFSAPFGQGKSTFLKYFFEQYDKDFEVIKVFPVNYSISHNEDVFKYIKTEILFQLLGKDIAFDKTDFSYIETLPSFIKKDPIRILAPLLRLIPKVGQNAHEVFQQLYKIAKDFFEYHESHQVNNLEQVETFIKEMYEKDGSVFEDNFFTQLIRQQLEKLKIKNKKKNVLIIEDLDRMDPEHIFRILNVFAAHFDAPEYLEGFTNKFGFDKIIIVADFENIKNIFSYRNGPNVNFSGYINKYFSREPFYFENVNAIKEFIYLMNKNNQEYGNETCFLMLTIVLSDLISINQLSLRDLIKLQKNELRIMMSSDQSIISNPIKSKFRHFSFFNLIYVLNKIFDFETLINKIQDCTEKDNYPKNINYGYFASLGLPSLIMINEVQESGKDSIDYKNLKLSFEYKLNWNYQSKSSFYEANNIIVLNEKTNSGEANYKLSSTDFYEILLLNIKRYKQIGGFD